MHSGINKTTFLDFDVYKNIIDSYIGPIEIQLEGGEPLLHPYISLFLSYATYTKKCDKIIISTNGILLDNFLDELVLLSERVPIVIKRSINYHLYELDKDIFKKCKDTYTAIEFIDNIDIVFNVRTSDGDGISDKLKEYGIREQSNVFPFQRYGRFSSREDLFKPFICENIDNWSIFASDGTEFGKDLIRRSIYEKTLK
jgi:MoaA/NifB/PqqE/SkfB family radical SAM enzyme